MPIRHVLVATDFSPMAEMAALRGCDLALQLGARVTLLYVFSPRLGSPLAIRHVPSAEERRALAESAQAELHQLATRVARGGLQLDCLAVEGDPHEVIPRIAERRQADLIVLGTHGRRGLARVALGSVAEAVVRVARCPVMTIGRSSIEAARAECQRGP